MLICGILKWLAHLEGKDDAKGKEGGNVEGTFEHAVLWVINALKFSCQVCSLLASDTIRIPATCSVFPRAKNCMLHNTTLWYNVHLDCGLATYLQGRAISTACQGISKQTALGLVR